MKVFVILVLSMIMMSGNVHAKCTNLVHEKKHSSQVGSEKVLVYECNVRATADSRSFNTDGSCKFCGCPQSAHNDD